MAACVPLPSRSQNVEKVFGEHILALQWLGGSVHLI